MRKSLLLFAYVFFTVASMVSGQTLTAHPQTDVYEGWKLGTQAWSFNRFTLFEAIEKTRSLGLDYMQAYPGQKVSGDIPAGFGPDLTAEQRQAVKDKLAENQVRIIAFGVAGIPADPAQARRLFEFAKEMGIQTIASEPPEDRFEMIDALCQKYEIKLAVHNHPNPSHYWHPDTVLKVCQDRSEWIGACADVGHWVRSGLDPVECLKKLEGRIQDVHIKEVDENGHDVIWGAAQGRIQGILEELHRQGYQGTFAIEYENNWENNLPQIRASIEHFYAVAQSLKPSGWKPLLETGLANMDMPKENWHIEDGLLTLKPIKANSDIWTKAAYGDFILDFEFKLAEGTNSGVFLRAAEHTWLPWPEVQVEDSFGKPIGKHICGAVYDIKEPSVNAVKKAGQWNRMTILAKGPYISVVLNSQPVIDLNQDHWTDSHQNPDGTKNKFDIAYKDLPRQGWIGFQDHGTTVWYRNMMIKED